MSDHPEEENNPSMADNELNELTALDADYEEELAEEADVAELDALEGVDQPDNDSVEASDLEDLQILDGHSDGQLDGQDDDDTAAELALDDNADLDLELQALQAMDGVAPDDLAETELTPTESDPPEPEPSIQEVLKKIERDSLKDEDWGGFRQEDLAPILEAVVFAHGKPITAEKILGTFDDDALKPSKLCVAFVLQELAADYQGRGIELAQVKSGYRFQTTHATAPQVQQLWDEKPQRYSRATLETLALIAYRQPITRGEIEDVRGVSVSSQIIKAMLDRDWIRVVGHRDVPGRPAMFATTKDFLDYFGLKSLEELPSLAEIRDLDELNPELGLDGQGEGAGQTEEGKPDRETTFSSLVEQIKEGEVEEEDESYIGAEFDDDLAAMDAVNKNFESMLESQRQAMEEQAEAEQQALDSVDTESAEEATSADSSEDAEPSVFATMVEKAEHLDLVPEVVAEDTSASEAGMPDDNLSEDEQMAIIQAKLAEQQALLSAKEHDDEEAHEESDD